MTDLDLYTGLPKEPAVYEQPADPTGGRLVAWAQAASAAHALAQSLSKTMFVPKEFRGKPDDTTAAILLGDELGLKPLAALKSVYVVHGTPSVYARTMVALLQSHGHEVWTESSTDREVVVSGRRKGSTHIETAKWDIGRAQKAGYTSNSKYQTNPQEMLWAKAASEVCRKVASDVLAGVPHSVEDLELEPENQPTVKVARSRVQRERPQPPEPEFDATPVARILPVDPPAMPEPAQEPVRATAERGEAGITDAQSKKLHALLREMGITDRTVGLAYIGDIVGRDVESSKTLTKAEASKAIDQMEQEREPAPEPDEPPLDGDWPTLPTPGGAA